MPGRAKQRLTSAPPKPKIGPPIDSMAIMHLIQKNRHIKLAGNEKLRIERELKDPKDRAQMVRDVLRSLGQPRVDAPAAALVLGHGAQHRDVGVVVDGGAQLRFVARAAHALGRELVRSGKSTSEQGRERRRIDRRERAGFVDDAVT